MTRLLTIILCTFQRHVTMNIHKLEKFNIYRIARNFRGSKLSRIHPKIIFAELIFAHFIIQPFLYRIFHNFADLKKSRKEQKLLASKVSSYMVIFFLQVHLIDFCKLLNV